MSIQLARIARKSPGGAGVLLVGIPGVPSAKVVVIGGGVVGTNALRMAIGMEAQVTVIDKSLPRLAQLDELFGARRYRFTRRLNQSKSKSSLRIS